MDKKFILENVKSDLHQIVDNIDFSNRELYETETQKYFRLLDSLADITLLDSKEFLPSENKNDNKNVSSHPDINQDKQNDAKDTAPVLSPVIEKEETPVEKEERKSYTFNRNLKAGTLVGTNIYVPEKNIRELDLNHGDKVHATFLTKGIGNSPDRYEFEVAERTGNPEEPKNRKQMNMCLVKELETLNRLYVDSTISGEYFTIDGLKHKIYLAEQDLYNLNVLPGDLVDVAFNIDQPQNPARILWKYETENALVQNEAKKSEVKSNTKEVKEVEEAATVEKEKIKEDKEDITEVAETGEVLPKETEDVVAEVEPIEEIQLEEDDDIQYDLHDKTILLMGAEPKKDQYERLITENNGTFEWASGRETEQRLRAKIRNADLVVFNLAHVGHMGTKRAIKYCKEYGVEHRSISHFGNTGFIRTIHDSIENPKRKPQEEKKAL